MTMEKNVNKYYILLGIFSFFGYFIGTTVFVLFGGKGSFYHSISGFLGAAVLAFAYSIYYQKRFPDLNRKAEQLLNDERSILIKGKSAEFTLKLLYLFLLIVMAIGMIIDDSWIRYASAGAFLVLNIINFIIFKVLDRKM
jgi:hypothetical protein